MDYIIYLHKKKKTGNKIKNKKEQDKKTKFPFG